MSTRKLYDEWSVTYDAVENRTRDLEKVACESTLGSIPFRRVLELGAGTGKNTSWLAARAERVMSVDFSPEMQAIARKKVTGPNVEFHLADVRERWDFGEFKPDLITSSLILEHVENIEFIFGEANKTLVAGGHFYICELHPFKQYEGSKARFETNEGLKVTDCYQHHVSDYSAAAFSNGFSLERLDEWFDEDDRSLTPRLLSLVFSK